jgi:hypothetical protein
VLPDRRFERVHVPLMFTFRSPQQVQVVLRHSWCSRAAQK